MRRSTDKQCVKRRGATNYVAPSVFCCSATANLNPRDLIPQMLHP